MRFFVLLLFVSVLFSCKKVEERYLFDKNSPEYAGLVQLSLSECVKDAKVFTSLETTSNFDKFIVGTVYKVVKTSSVNDTYFFKILSISSGLMKVAVKNIDGSFNKIIDYTETMNTDLLNVLKNGICHPKDFIQASSLSSTTTLTYTWKKETITVVDGTDEGTEPDVYKQDVDKRTFNVSYPLFMYLFNGTIDKKIRNSEPTQEIKEQFVLTSIVNDQDAACTVSSTCDFSDVASITKVCTPKIDTNSYEKNSVGTEFINLEDSCT